MSAAYVPVSEIFGPTIQGEGALVGARTLFVRVGGCDYRCSWCDTPYAVLTEHRSTWNKMTPADIVAACLALAPSEACPWVTLSGGNPALFTALEPVVRELQKMGYRIAVETQGSAPAQWFGACDHVTFSPKPPSSGMVVDRPDWRACLAAARTAKDACVKIVAFDDADLAWAAVFVEQEVPWETSLYLSAGTPQGAAPDDTREEILDRTRWLIDAAGEHPSLTRARILPQLHVLLWGTRRGV